MPAPAASGLAIASLVLGILWLGGIGSILAVIFGIVAISQIRRSNRRKGGDGLAIAGIVLGGFGILGTVALATAIPGLTHTIDRALHPEQLQMGQPATLSGTFSDGVVSVTVQSVNVPTATANTEYTPSAGNEFLVATVRLCAGPSGFTGTTGEQPSGSAWELTMHDGSVVDTSVDAVPHGLDTISAIPAGQCTVGSLTFEIPFGSSPASVQYRGEPLTPFAWVISG